MKRIISIAVVLFAGCAGGGEKVVDRVDLGRIIAASYPPTSWNESPKTQVECENASVILSGSHSVLKGKKATLARFDNGEQWLVIDGDIRMRRAY